MFFFVCFFYVFLQKKTNKKKHQKNIKKNNKNGREKRKEKKDVLSASRRDSWCFLVFLGVSRQGRESPGRAEKRARIAWALPRIAWALPRIAQDFLSLLVERGVFLWCFVFFLFTKNTTKNT